MTRLLWAPCALSISVLAAPLQAQVVIESSTTTTAEVTVTGRVTTTSTETVIVPAPEPAPSIVEVAPSSSSSSSSGASLAPLLVLRGELVLSGAHDMPMAGMTALFGADGGDGWGGGLVAGYFGEMGTSAPSEVHLALEAWRDFGPTDFVAFQLLARAGTSLVLEERGPSARVLAQLGIGARVSMDSRIAILIDARGELRVRPAQIDAGLAHGPDLSAGFVMTMGLAIRLD